MKIKASTSSQSMLIYLMLGLSVFLSSCDPESCRDCGTFNFDLSEWSRMDDTIKTTYVFIDRDSNATTLLLEGLVLSDTYVECGIGSTPEDIGCELTKKMEYSSDALDFKFIIYYQQLENPGGNPALNRCNYLIELLDDATGEHLLTVPFDLFSGVDTVNVLEPIGDYEIANKKYTNVLRRTIDSMMVYDSYQTIDVEFVEPKIREIYFQVPNGIIGLTLENGKQLILIE